MRRRVNSATLMIKSVLLVMIVHGTASGKTIYVDDDGPADFNNIQAAINNANNGDIIEVQPGTYTGAGNRDIDFKGKAITVRGVTGDANDCVIDCQGDVNEPHRGFKFVSGEDANSVLEGFTITNGYGPEEDIYGNGNLRSVGGSVYCKDSRYTINNCTLRDNSADIGGGIYNRYSSPTISNCTIKGNSACWGGGISNDWFSNPIINHCVIINNSAFYSGAGTPPSGGGIFNKGRSSPIISNCTVSNNSARLGGGIGNYYNSSPSISNCTLSNNSAIDYGGGIYDYSSSNPSINNCAINNNSANAGGGISNYDSEPSIERCTISNNSASYGGGIHNDGSAPTINWCIISGNSAEGGGGGVANLFYSRAFIKECTINGNSANNGGGICNSLGFQQLEIRGSVIVDNSAVNNGGGIYNNDVEVLLTNCTIANNSAGWGGGLYNNGSEQVIFGSIVWWNQPSQIHGSASAAYSDIQGWGDLYFGNISVDPEFASDGYHLTILSPCFDAGYPDYIAEPNETDIDGDPRVVGRIDMGADEFFVHGSGALFITTKYYEFQAFGIDSNTTPQSLCISNYGELELNWQIQIPDDCDWLSVSALSGQTASLETSEVSISIDHNNIDYGTFSCQLNVSDPNAENSPQVVTVNLDVLGPVLVISDLVFNFTMAGIDSNTAPASQVLTIQNTGYDILAWHIEMPNDCDWLKASHLAGQAGHMETDEVILSIDHNNIDYGTFSCQLNVSDPNAENSPQVVTVNLDVLGPVLTVNPAQFYFETSLAEPNTTGQILYIQNTGYDTLNWDVNIPVGCNWLNASEISGQSTGELDEVILSIDHNNVERGFHQCKILISAPDAENSPQVIPVGLRVLGMKNQRYVPTEYPTIQAAVDAAVDGDEVIIEPGIYNEPGNYNIYLRCNAITVRSIDPNNPAIVAATVIEPNTIASGFIFHCYYFEQGDSIIDGLTIRRCIDRPAIICSDGSPTICNCIIEDNYYSYSPYYGGIGIDCHDSNAVISNCVIRNNQGGGLRCTNSDPTVQNCIFTGNRGFYSYSTGGGFIVMSFGGGILHWGGNLSVINCTFSGNLADVGGGICSFGSYAYWNNMTISNCIFWGNDANDGPQIALIDHTNNPPTVSVSYSDVEGGEAAVFAEPYSTLEWGKGNIDIDPCFAKPGHWELSGTPEDVNDDFWVDGDYHLKSQEGRWKPLIYTGLDSNNDGFINQVDFAAFANSWRKQGAAIPADFDHSGIVDFSDLRLLLNNYPSSYTPGQWVLDDATSPCIDAGDPNSDWRGELWSHGNRINMGAYGGTPEASMSLSDAGNIADLNFDGVLCYRDMKLLTDKWLCQSLLMSEDLSRDGIVNFTDFSIFARIWGFPGPASHPNPPNGAAPVNITADLSWKAGRDATSHDVYFGTSDPPPYIRNQTNTIFDPGTMDYSTTYFWRIDEVNEWGITIGPVWSFTTIMSPPPPPPP